VSLRASAAEVARQLTIDVGVRLDTVAVDIQLLVIHQPTFLGEYDRLHVGKIRQRVNELQFRYLQHAHTRPVVGHLTGRGW